MEQDSPYILPLLVVIGPVILALLTTILNAWGSSNQRAQEAEIRREEKKLDWARQDIVAAKAEQTASMMLQATHSNNEKLDIVHALVNSNLTAAMQAEYDSMTRELALMHEVMEMRLSNGQEPSEHTKSAIVVTEAKLKELGERLVARAAQQADMDKLIAAEKSVLKVQQVVTEAIIVGTPPVPEGEEH